MVGFYKHKICRIATKMTYNQLLCSYSLYTSIFYPLVPVTYLNASQNQLLRINRKNYINETEKNEI